MAHNGFKVGDVVCYRAGWLRSVGWYTDVPINGEVTHLDRLGDQVLVEVVWADGREIPRRVLASNLIHYDRRHTEPA